MDLDNKYIYGSFKPNNNIVSYSDSWGTPKDLYSELDKEFNFSKFDPCPINSKEDGLLLNWYGRVFCNPPYSKIKDFLKKGIDELTVGRCSVLVYLLPVWTADAWFHEYVVGRCHEIRFIKGFLKFSGKFKNSFEARFSNMIVIFRR